LNSAVLPAAVLGNYGLLSVLCETPSGFAIFSYHGSKIVKPDGCQVLTCLILPSRLFFSCRTSFFLVDLIYFFFAVLILYAVQKIWADFVGKIKVSVPLNLSPGSIFIYYHDAHAQVKLCSDLCLAHVWHFYLFFFASE
jgi:hypothetical protein